MTVLGRYEKGSVLCVLPFDRAANGCLLISRRHTGGRNRTHGLRTVVRRFLDLFDRAGPIFKSADIIDLVVTHILEDLPGERRTTAGSAIEDNGLFLIEILVVVWRVRVGAKFQHSA